MASTSTFSINQLRDYSSLFSRNQVKPWFKNDFTSIYHKIKRYDEDWSVSYTHLTLPTNREV